MIEQLSKIWTKQLRYNWSQLRHIHTPNQPNQQQQQIYSQWIPKTIPTIKNIAYKLYNRFQYTNDHWDRLYDSIDTPISCVIRAFEHPPLKDDCDGFHSALYWFVSQTFNTRLLTVVTNDIRSSHSLLICQYKKQYFYVDYTYISDFFDTINDAVLHLNNRLYKPKNLYIMYYELSQFNNTRWISKIF